MKALLLGVLIVLAPQVLAQPWTWAKRLCSEHLVIEDPYQYEFYATAWLLRELDRLEIQAAWNKASEIDLEHIQLIRRELARRNNNA